MNQSDLTRDYYMLKGKSAAKGYDWWWHNFTGVNPKTGEKKAFFVEYFIMNPALSPDKVVLGQEENSKKEGKRPSYAMLKVGEWGKNAKQLHAFYPLSECQIAKDSLNVTFGNATLTETHMQGSVTVTKEQAKNPGYMCDAGELSYDLNIHKKIAFHVGYGASRFFRWLNAFEMFWHAEGMKTEYEGTVTLDGITYEVTPDTSYGYADKNWGKDFTSPWVWFSAWNLKSLLDGKRLHDSVIDIGGGRPKVLGMALNRKLLIDLHYEGKDYEYNFSKFWTRSQIKFDCEEKEDLIIWRIKACNKDSRLELLGKCKKSEMLLINYEAPNGKKLHNRLWNGGTGYGQMKLYDKEGNLIDHIGMKNAGCEYGVYC